MGTHLNYAAPPQPSLPGGERPSFALKGWDAVCGVTGRAFPARPRPPLS